MEEKKHYIYFFLYVFTAQLGGKMNPDNVTSHLRRFSKKLDLPHINPHRFRHTAASLLIARGVDVATAASYVGDTIETIEKAYVHPYEDRKIAAINFLSDVIMESDLQDPKTDK